MSTQKKSMVTRAFLISLAVLILCSIVNWGVITEWGKVEVSRLTLVGDNGAHYSALIYVPETATDEEPAPGIMMFHGAGGNARNHEAWAVEFARRGFVCLSVDYNGAGDSESVKGVTNYAPLDLFTQYMYNLPIVDKERIAFSGHSMGGDGAMALAPKYSPQVILLADYGGVGEPEEPIMSDIFFGVGDSDMVNALPDYCGKMARRLVFNGMLEEGDTVEPDVLYGSFEEGNAALMGVFPKQLHETALTNHDHIAAMIDFTQKAFDVPNPIDGNDQIWKTKDVMGIIGMFALIATMLLFALLMIEKIPAFAIIKQPLPRNIGMRGIPLAISIIAAIVFPVLCLYTGCFGLLTLLAGGNGKGAPISWLPVCYTNISLTIIIGLNVFGGLMFLLYHYTWGKKKFQAKVADYGLTTAGNKKLSFELIWKSALVSVITFIAGWGYLSFLRNLTGTEFYCLYFGYKAIAAIKLASYIPYMIIWAICFVVAVVGMCVERRLPSTGKVWLDDMIAVVFNAVLATGAISAVVLLHYNMQLHLGSSAIALGSWKTQISRLWGLPVGMLLGAGGNTFMYRKTGNVWVGAILMGMVCAVTACTYGQI